MARKRGKRVFFSGNYIGIKDGLSACLQAFSKGGILFLSNAVARERHKDSGHFYIVGGHFYAVGGHFYAVGGHFYAVGGHFYAVGGISTLLAVFLRC
ncbi:hypothetical protein HY768_07160 [candidate division TA06 bacterium]|uniref:Uncharacterized protein n=1 Tax=candidate division TA06 bacterium TaxID=2250710 RepID=A0A933IBY1_UNCT6|nr:hypothetical protein [candidate division TA06 bacterium]